MLILYRVAHEATSISKRYFYLIYININPHLSNTIENQLNGTFVTNIVCLLLFVQGMGIISTLFSIICQRKNSPFRLPNLMNLRRELFSNIAKMQMLEFIMIWKRKKISFCHWAHVKKIRFAEPPLILLLAINRSTLGKKNWTETMAKTGFYSAIVWTQTDSKNVVTNPWISIVVPHTCMKFHETWSSSLFLYCPKLYFLWCLNDFCVFLGKKTEWFFGVVNNIFFVILYEGEKNGREVVLSCK